MSIQELYNIYKQHPIITTDSRDCPEGSIFFALKAINKLSRKKEEEPAAPAGPTQEELLGEIRDLLKNK